VKLDNPFWKFLDEQDELGEDAGGGVTTEEVADETASDDPPPEESSEDDEPASEESEDDEQSLMDLVKEAGLDIEAPDDFAAAKAIIEQAKSVKGLREQQAKLEQQRQLELQMWQRTQQVPQQPQVRKGPLDDLPETSRLRHWKNKPEWDPLWLTKLQQDDKGNVVARPGEDPQLPYKVRAYLDWEERAKRIQTDDPLGFFWDVATVHPEFSGAINSIVEQAVASAVANLRGESLIEKSRGELFDDKGQPTAFGQAYAEAVEDYRRLGITDPTIVHPRAVAMARAKVPQQPKEKTPDSRHEKRFKWMKNAASKGKSQGAKPGSSRKATASSDDLKQAILDEFAANGTGPHDLVK
jgi:hypothetical protein